MKHRISKKFIIQFSEFMLGGGIHFWTGLAIFTLLYSFFKVDWLVSKLVGDVVGWSLGYLVQRYVAFENKKLKGQDARVISRYIVVNIADFALYYLIVAGVIFAGFSPYAGFIVSAGVTTIWDYYWYKYWVFRPESSK